MIHFPLDNNNALTTPRLKIHSNAPTMSTVNYVLVLVKSLSPPLVGALERSTDCETIKSLEKNAIPCVFVIN